MPETGVFYDLGSGTGKGVISAALLHPFEKVVGVEILEKLVTASLELVEKYNLLMPAKTEESPELFPTIPPIEIQKNDFFQADFFNADILFLNSTCYTQEMMNALGKLPVKKGAFAITLSKNF